MFCIIVCADVCFKGSYSQDLIIADFALGRSGHQEYNFPSRPSLSALGSGSGRFLLIARMCLQSAGKIKGTLTYARHHSSSWHTTLGS